MLQRPLPDFLRRNLHSLHEIANDDHRLIDSVTVDHNRAPGDDDRNAVGYRRAADEISGDQQSYQRPAVTIAIERGGLLRMSANPQASTALMLVGFEGFTLSPCYRRADGRATCVWLSVPTVAMFAPPGSIRFRVPRRDRSPQSTIPTRSTCRIRCP